ncbi:MULTISPECIES: hypothetical protein [unclassified Streptomyces]|uniref:hypothetical protein n=1 Tax=Streptomyces sp. ZSW22 TaxID=3055050 RepID=UPI000BCC8661|nr:MULTISPECIES: hypothetical protein [unclassified Streptomyces]MDN3249636.1 hypothetical protein [Streptomyces sp. ZSW22]PAK23912.1 hypothetical protein CJD44_25800 [Streptomyces sp. alain-838]
MLFETADGVRVDLVVFINCRCGHDIQCETGGGRERADAAAPPDPATAAVHGAGRHGTAVHQE